MKKTLGIVVSLCVFIGVFSAAGPAAAAPFTAEPAVSDSAYLRADASRVIVVLGARINADGSLPAILSSRLQRAAALAHAAPRNRIVLTGGDTGSGVFRLTEAQRMHVELTLNHGVAPWRVTRDDTSQSTVSNATHTAALLHGMGARGAVVVTQGWHMGRALGDFRSAAPDLKFVPAYAR